MEREMLLKYVCTKKVDVDGTEEMECRRKGFYTSVVHAWGGAGSPVQPPWRHLAQQR